MRSPRVKIYLQFKHLIKILFTNLDVATKNVKKKFSDETKKKHVQFFGMCRTCFIVILEYLIEHKPQKNEIVICSYNLEEMIEIAKIYQFNVKLIDIEHKTGVMNIDLIKKNISSKTSAILYTNMFNNYSELKELKIYCNEKDILLIEDNAIYLGNYYQDKDNKVFSGSFGDVSIFSFGIMKNISAIFGGALVTSDNDINNFAIKKIKEFQKFPFGLYLKKFLLFLILKFSLSKYVYNFLFFYIIKFAHNLNIKFLLKLIYPSYAFKPKKKIPSEYKSKISKISLKIIHQIISDPDIDLERKKRKENNMLYFNLLSQNKNIGQINIEDHDFQNFLDFPIIVKNNKDELVRFLFDRGLEIRYHFYSNFDKYLSQKKNNNSSYYEENLICLPSHSGIEKKKIFKYCEEINNFYLNE